MTTMEKMHSGHIWDYESAQYYSLFVTQNLLFFLLFISFQFYWDTTDGQHYTIKVYGIMTWPKYVLQNDHHN